jgi:hypothetical protein
MSTLLELLSLDDNQPLHYSQLKVFFPEQLLLDIEVAVDNITVSTDYERLASHIVKSPSNCHPLAAVFPVLELSLL